MTAETAKEALSLEEKERAYAQIANIDLYRRKEDSLVQILHLAQEIYGHLPLELQQFISREMNIPLSQVSGVVSFYSFFPPSQEAGIPYASARERPAMSVAVKRLWNTCKTSFGLNLAELRTTAVLPLRLPGVLAPAAWRRRL